MINLYDILDAADGQLFGDPQAQLFSGFSFDHRQVQPGDLYVALKTESRDGHHYMEQAIQAGATGLMCHHPPNFETEGVTVMIMRDVEGALMRWTKFILNKFGTTVIGVAGKQGKSITCAAIAQVLGGRYKVYYERTDFSGQYAIPLTLSKLNSDYQLVILELNAGQLGEMQSILAAVAPSVAVVTNIGGDESSNYNNPLLPEIQSLLGSLPGDGLAVLNFDSEAVRNLAKHSSSPSVTVSLDREGRSYGADLIAYNLVVAVDKTGFDLRYGSERYVARWVPLLGAHQLYPALYALAVGLAFQVPLEEGLAALTHLEPMPGRMRPLVGANGCLLIDDSHHGTGHSLRAALQWLKAILPKPSSRETVQGLVSPRGTIYLVLGEVDELDERFGVDSQSLGDQLVEVANVVVTEGEAAALLARSALEHGIPLTQIHMTFSPQDAAAAIRTDLRAKDVVLVTGSASARMERVAAELLADPAQAKFLPRHYQLDLDDPGRNPLYHTWTEVNLEAIAQNTRRAKEALGPDCRLMAVVKADAYGHGAVAVSTTALLNGASYLAVNTLQEALALRQAGLTESILILNYLPPAAAAEALRYDLTVTLYDQQMARSFQRALANSGKKLRAHVRLDVGGGGIGALAEDVVMFFRVLNKLDALQVEGIYTTLDSQDPGQAGRELNTFQDAVRLIRVGEFKMELLHAANSGQALHLPDSRLDIARVGRALYGLDSGPAYPLPPDFSPALAWKTTVAQVKRMQGRMLISKEGIPMPTKPRTVAVLPLGYTEGLRPAWQQVLIHGQRVPVVGGVGSYQTLADIQGLDDVRIGDEVVLIGRQGEAVIRAEEGAAWLGVEVDELLSLLLARTPQVKV